MKTAFQWILALLPALAAPCQDAIPLGYGVPEKVHVYVHGLGSETPDPAMVRFEHAVQGMFESGIHEDFLDLITVDLRPERRRAVKDAFERVLAIFGKVDWGLLTEREMVFSYRIAFPMPEYLFLFRVPRADLAAQRSAVQGMLADLGELVGESASVREVERTAGAMTVFSISNAPLELAAGAVGDVLVMSTSTRMLSASMKLLEKADGEGSLLTTGRYSASLQALPAPTEGVVFLDLEGLIGFASEAAGMAVASMHGPEAEPLRSVLALIGACFEELDLVDHVMITTVSDGRTVVSNERLVMQPGFESTRFAALFRDQRPWRDWQRMVPANATGFWFDTGADPVALLDLGTALVRENWAGAEHFLDQGEAGSVLAEVRDLLTHFSGEVAWVALPEEEAVLFLRLAKTEGLSDRIGQALGDCSRFLASRGQVMDVAQSDGLYEVQFEVFPHIHPVLGVRDDILVCATSRAALAAVDAAHGRATIRGQQRFLEMGVGTGDSADYLAYAQVDAPLRGLHEFLGAAGFFLSVLPEDRDTLALRKTGALCTKLARALREMDISYDWATEMLPGGEPGVFLGRTVYRYR